MTIKENVAVVLAGGSGSRFGADKPKQFLLLGSKTILEHSVDAFEQHGGISEVVIVSNPGFLDEVREIAARRGWKKLRHILPGGKERYDSSLAAIRAYAGKNVNLIFHDAVRPLVSQNIIGRVVEALREHGAVNVAVPAVDTILERSDNFIASIPDRSRLMRAQTPQAFRLSLIEEAYRHALSDPDFRATDDCGVLLRYLPEARIRLVEGEESNLKLTYREDLFVLEKFLQMQEKQPRQI